MGLQNINCRQGKNGTCHHSARTGANALNNDVLAQRTFTFGHRRGAYGNNSDRDSGLKHLAYLQTQIGGGSRKYHRHYYAPCYRPRVHLRIHLIGIQHGLILFAFLQFAESVFRQLHCLVFLIFHLLFCLYFIRVSHPFVKVISYSCAQG